jgi:signal transduction histidine kinase
MHALNGIVSVTDAPEGGAQFTLQFPSPDVAVIA